MVQLLMWSMVRPRNIPALPNVLKKLAEIKNVPNGVGLGFAWRGQAPNARQDKGPLLDRL